jgi:quercetin dioxygenase-like cupin family protein
MSTPPPAAAEYVGKEQTGAAGRGPISVTWSLTGPTRDLDANVVRLAPDAYIAEHTETVLGVLVTVLAGSGEVRTPDAAFGLEPGVLAWLPAGTTRSVHAGPDGLTYTTAHRRRPPMSIGSARPSDAGEAACLLDRVCPECGRLATERDARFCARCGTSLGER